MKPKTKAQKRIVDLSSTLPLISAKQQKYASKHCFDHQAVKRRDGYICTHCGTKFETFNKKCPHCGYILTSSDTRKRTLSESCYFSIITKCHEWQVIRIFVIHKNVKFGYPAEYQMNEVIQQWIDNKGKCLYMALKRNMGIYFDLWNYDSNLTLRGESSVYNPYAVIYPYMSVTDTIQRNGFNGDFLSLKPKDFFCAILSDYRYESLLKMGQTKLFEHVATNRTLLRFWKSIVICQRHGYKIDEPSNWLDMMNILERMGKDLNSPKYIMPEDIKSAHDHWVKKMHHIQQKERFQRELEQAKEQESIFRKLKSRFFGISITENDLTICVLESVREHILEGKALCHCVGQCGYALKEKSLILSAMVNGVRTETIEINLDRLDIVQCYGVYNKPSPHHERIINLMNRNLYQIKRRMTA